MKMYLKDNLNYIQFENDEEIRVFSKFLYENDYFLREKFETLKDYTDYIISLKDSIYVSNDYHQKLTEQLIEKLDTIKLRKYKLGAVYLN